MLVCVVQEAVLPLLNFIFHGTHFKSMVVTGTSSMALVPTAVCS